MQGRKVTMLGTGLIGDFYTATLHGPRTRDSVGVVYSRSEERGKAFSDRWDIPAHTTSLEDAINHPDTDVVVVGLPNFLHEEAIALTAEAGKAVLVTKPLARDGAEAKRILERVEASGVFGGYLEDLVYTPKSMKAVDSVRSGGDRRRDLGAGAGDSSRAAQRLVLGQGKGGWRRHRRSRVPLHRDHPLLRREEQPACRGDGLG